MAKFQYNKYQKIIWKKHQSEFVTFDFVKNWLDIFLGKYFSDKKEFWHIFKLIFALLHEQSYVEHGFLLIKGLLRPTRKKNH